MVKSYDQSTNPLEIRIIKLLFEKNTISCALILDPISIWLVFMYAEFNQWSEYFTLDALHAW